MKVLLTLARLAAMGLLLLLGLVYVLVLLPVFPTAWWVWAIGLTQVAGWGYVVVRKVVRKRSGSGPMQHHHVTREGLL